MDIMSLFTKLLELFLKQNIEEQIRIADYLDRIVVEARQLEGIWEELLAIVINHSENDAQYKRIYSDQVYKDKALFTFRMSLLIGDYLEIRKNIEKKKLLSPQGMHFSYLASAYFDISNCIGGKTNLEFHDKFVYYLSSILKTRQDAINILESLEYGYIDDQEIKKILNNLQTDVASLNYLADRFRANISIKKQQHKKRV